VKEAGMATRASDTTPEFWDGFAEHYDRDLAPLSVPFAEAAIRLTETRPGRRILDVATGTGAFALLVAQTGAEVLAVDFAPAMIARLRERAAGDGLATLTAEVMDGQALALPEAAFDVAVSMFGVIFFPEPAAGYREMFRVLRPGDVGLVAGWGKGAFWPSMVATQAVARALPQRVQARGQQSPSDPGKFEEALRAAGFRDVRAESIEQRVWTGIPAEQVWGRVRLWPQLQYLDDAELDAVRPVFFEVLRERFGAGPIEFNRVAHLAFGTK
jgi:ubiquinone/menaquinone biosynthesis C-methylase UbiE